MTYSVESNSAAQREIRKLPPETKPRILSEIAALAEDPRSQGIKLEASERFRKRVGTYRIVYAVDDPTNRVVIIRVKHRREVYRGK